MSGNVFQLLAALAGGGILGRLLFWRVERDSVIAAASGQAIEAVNLSLDRVQSDLERAYSQIDKLTRENDVLRGRVMDLERQGVMCSTCPLRRTHG